MSKNRLVLSLVLFGLLFGKPGFIFAQTPSDIDQTINKLSQDPNTMIMVKNATYSSVVASPTVEAAPQEAQIVNVVVNSPQEGAVLVDTSVIFSGKAPPNTLVSIHIHDDDFDVSYIQHEVLQHTLGSTTSDKDGNWVYSPQVKLVVGKYWIQATVNDNLRGSIQSPQVHFTVANALGQTQEIIFYRSSQFWIAIIILVAIIAALLFLLKKKLHIRLMPPTFPKVVVETAQETTQKPDEEIVSAAVPEETHKESAFLTSAQLAEERAQDKKESKEQLQKLESLEEEISKVKETLAATADNIALAGQATEKLQSEIAKEKMTVQEEKDKSDVVKVKFKRLKL